VLRVAPDVQALVQAAISDKGAAGLLIASWERRETIVVTCEEIVASYEDVLHRPHSFGKFRHISNQSIAASGEALRERSVLVRVDDIPEMVLADPDDNVVLACAVDGNADYVVSRDRHLLELGMHRGIPIVTPEAFAAILCGQVSEELRIHVARPLVKAKLQSLRGPRAVGAAGRGNLRSRVIRRVRRV